MICPDASHGAHSIPAHLPYLLLKPFAGHQMVRLINYLSKFLILHEFMLIYVLLCFILPIFLPIYATSSNLPNHRGIGCKCSRSRDDLPSDSKWVATDSLGAF